MPTRLLIFLCSISPALRRLLWRWWYSKLAREIATVDWTFMNYGFVGSPEDPHLKLQPADEPDRLCIQLYERATSSVELGGLRILEVGCGRGGGSSYLARYRRPMQVTGMDYSPDAIAFCRRRHGQTPNLTFAVGDAERLPFADASFDVVVNVESSHCYGNIQKFFSEVIRVLRPGGYFLFADLRESTEMAELTSLLATNDKWEKTEDEDITANVAAALNADDVRKREMIAKLVVPKLQPVFSEFAGVKDGKVYSGLTNKDLLYFRFVLRRK
jgi:SAM-dependent methyltransferase